MSLSRYSVEVRAIADSIGRYLYEADLVETAHHLADTMGPQGIFRMTPEDRDKALKFLSQTPSQQVKVINKLDDEAAALLIMRAKFFGIISARSMSLAENFEYVPGKGYRDAAAYGASVYLRSPIVPTIEDILPRWKPKEELNARAAPGQRR